MRPKFSILNVLLLFSALAFVACVITIVMSARAEARFRAQAQLSSEVIEQLNGVIISALNAETGQRGYLLTGDEAYLAPYETGAGIVRERIDGYRSLIADNILPSQAATLTELTHWTEVKLTELASTTDLYRSGDRSGAIRLVNTGAGEDAMGNIRRLTADLIEQQYRIQNSSHFDARLARLSVLVSVVALTFLSLFGFGLAYRNLQRSEKLDVVEHQAQELVEERARADLLARELNHRVKTLFAIVQSIVSATARRETDLGAAARKIRDRVHALSSAHSLTSSVDMQQQTTLAALVEAVVASQIDGNERFAVSGPEIAVKAHSVTPLGMILHELTTNAVKYGAWSEDRGKIDVTWTVEPGADGEGQELYINWVETRSARTNPPEIGADGFGSRMIGMSIAQLGGRSTRNWRIQGLNLDVIVPLNAEGAVSGRNQTAT